MMNLLSASIKNTALVIPLGAALNASRDAAFTGLIHAGAGDGVHLDLVMYSGRLIRAYLFRTHTRPEYLPESQLPPYSETFENLPAAQVKLPVYALRLVMLFSESAGEGDVRQLPTNELVSLLPIWQGLQASSLVSFHWSGADALLFLPGGGSYARHAAFIAREKVEQEIIPAIEMWEEPTCRLMRHVAIPDTPAWREFHLCLAFTVIANTFLARYEQFGGRPVINDLSNQLNEVVQEQGWNIGFSGANVFDRQLYADEQQAARVYRALLRAMFSHAEAVLGAPRTESLFRMIISQSDAAVRTCARDFALLPENALVGGD